MDLTNEGRRALVRQTVGHHYDALSDVRNEVAVMGQRATFLEDDGMGYQLSLWGAALDALLGQLALFPRSTLLMPGNRPEVERADD